MATGHDRAPAAGAAAMCSRHPACSLSALAEHLGMTPPACSSLVERLVRAGWLDRDHRPARAPPPAAAPDRGWRRTGRAGDLRARTWLVRGLAELPPADLRALEATLGPAGPRHGGGRAVMTDLAIETHALRADFKEVTAVESLDLAIPGDQVFGLLGPNGAGKTTTIKMLITLLPPTAGQAWVAGFDIVQRAGRRAAHDRLRAPARVRRRRPDRLREPAALGPAVPPAGRRARDAHRRGAGVHGPDRGRGPPRPRRTRGA